MQMIEQTHPHDTDYTPEVCSHTHETSEPFPPLEENLYISLSRIVMRDKQPHHEAPVDEQNLEQLVTVEARLGDRWSKQMTTAQRAKVATLLSQQRSELPTSHPLFEQQHAHSSHTVEGGHSCGKLHGPLRRRFDALEAKVIGRISNHTAKAVAAAVFRLSALTVCPGDDIAAIGLQIHSAVAGHHEAEHSHHDEQAILPRSVRIETDQATQPPRDNDPIA